MSVKPSTPADLRHSAEPGSTNSAGTMMAAVWIAFAVVAWFAVYQGTMAYIIRPPEIPELGRAMGRIVRVDTPVPRNRNDPYSELVIEAGDGRLQRVPVRHESLERQRIEALDGQMVDVRFAGSRPRNRWAYEIAAGGQPILAYLTERERDERVRRNSLMRALASAATGGGLLAAIAAMRRRGRRG